ncbi:MAG: hypothetical protein CMF23_06775 [Ignavibacteriae bacterium]|nr:hypothetical protein [Ignavibacteriota bacterium]
MYDIFIVEDNSEIQQSVEDLLTLCNYKVKSFNNGKEAFDFLTSSKTYPNLIISDIMMPIMDGYSLKLEVDRLKLRNKIGFIFLTARIDHSDKKYAKSIGVNSYITKPFKAIDLIKEVESILSLN